jgi:hypothetical protein
LPQIPLSLLDPIPLHALRSGSAIPLPVAWVVEAPLVSAVAADLAIFGIEGKLLLTLLAMTLLLARFVRTCDLLWMKSGGFEVPLAETATPRGHPFRVGFGKTLLG